MFNFLRITGLILLITFFQNIGVQAQTHNKGKFIDPKSEAWEDIRKGIDEFNKKDEKKKLTYKMDFDNVKIPLSPDEFNKSWHNEPLSQGNTGTCWCFCGTSFLESEIFRLFNKKIKISEMHTVYWQYVEKAKRFVEERGKSEFGEGSQANGVTTTWKKYGCVPAEVYTGKKNGQKHHDHSKLFQEMRSYLNSISETNNWNEELVISTIKSILNHYLGEPPTEFNYNGTKFTPKSFLENEIKINCDDYIDIMSLLEKENYKKVEYEVPDNWWHCSEYHNVPLDDYMSTIKSILKKGYTIAIGGDVSEAGLYSYKNVAMVPTFDIPSEYIDEYARQFRFSNNTTTDDHGIHIVGYKDSKEGTWYLVKDSGAGSRNGTSKGYYFFHEDYIKLKMMTILVHKSAVTDLLKKFDK